MVLTWLWLFDLMLKPILGNDQSIPKTVAHIKSVQVYLTTFTKVKANSWYTQYYIKVYEKRGKNVSVMLQEEGKYEAFLATEKLEKWCSNFFSLQISRFHFYF